MKDSLVVRALEVNEYSTWDALVKASPAGTIYHDSRWLRTISNAVGNTFAIFGFFHDGQLLAGTPLQVRSRGPLKLARRAFATPYAGMVTRPNLGDREREFVVCALDRFRKKFSHITLTGSPYAPDSPPRPGWHVEERATYLIDITEPERVWRSFVCQLRNKVRKAEHAGVTVRRGCEPTAFYKLYHDTFARQGLCTPFVCDTFCHLIDQVETLGIGHTYVAVMPDGAPCTAGLILYDEKRVYSSLAASDSALRKTGAMSMLFWHVIEDFSAAHNEFDLGGANMPSVRQFKSQFRGRLVTYPEASRYRSFFEKLAIEAYFRVVDIRRRRAR